MRKAWIISISVGIFTTGLALGWWLRTSAVGHSVNHSSSISAGATPEGSASVQTLPKNSPPRVEFASRLNEVLQHRSQFRRARLINSIAVDLNIAEVLEALGELERTPIREKTQIHLKLLARWSELEPDAALEYARALPQQSAHDAIKAVIGSWCKRDPKAVESRIENLPNGWAKSVAWSGFIEALSERDPKRAFTVAQKTEIYYDFIPLFDRWGSQNPEEAAAHAATVPPGFWRDQATRIAAQKWAEADVDSALAWAQSLPVDNGYLTSIERRDPRPLAAVLETWIGNDADAAVHWLEQLPDDVVKTDVLAALSKSLSDTAPARAVDLAAMMPPGTSQDRALRELIRNWSNKDFAGALKWAQEQMDPEVRRALLPTLVKKLAGHDTEAALSLALSSGEAGVSAVNSVLHSWATKTPVTAAAWVEAQPYNVEYSASVATAWAREDQKGAAQWINRIPAGPERDQLLTAVAGRFLWGEPQMAAKWAADIGDSGKRLSVYRDIAARWLRIDPKAARTWIHQTSLPASVKAQLLQARSH